MQKWFLPPDSLQWATIPGINTPVFWLPAHQRGHCLWNVLSTPWHTGDCSLCPSMYICKHLCVGLPSSAGLPYMGAHRQRQSKPRAEGCTALCPSYQLSSINSLRNELRKSALRSVCKAFESKKKKNKEKWMIWGSNSSLPSFSIDQWFFWRPFQRCLGQGGKGARNVLKERQRSQRKTMLKYLLSKNSVLVVVLAW